MSSLGSPADARLCASASLYGLLVFGVAALIGFVLAPWLGTALGLFELAEDSEGFFSFLTLRGVPFLAAASAASAVVYPVLAKLTLRMRAALLIANAVVAWIATGGMALAILG